MEFKGIKNEINDLKVSNLTGKGLMLLEELETILDQHSKMVEMLEKVGRHHQGGHSEIGFEIKELLKEVKA